MGDREDGTMEVDPSLDDTVTVHGREFQKHAVENDIQYLPIDEEEIQRLEHQHRVYGRIFDSKLVFPPVTRMTKILDLGYGSAAWAIELAESHPECEVTGVDISHQMLPDDAPENFWPVVDDLNKVFTDRSNQYDLICSRGVGAGINKHRWPSYIRDIKRCLKPGAWCQLIEFYYMAQSDNGSLNESHGLREWSTKYIQALEVLKDPRSPMQFQARLSELGFINIESKMIPVPMCGWPTNPRERRIGELQGEIIEATFRSLSLYPLTAKLGMSLHDFDKLIERATEEASNPGFKAYFPLYVCIGQKPSR